MFVRLHVGRGRNREIVCDEHNRKSAQANVFFTPDAGDAGPARRATARGAVCRSHNGITAAKPEHGFLGELTHERKLPLRRNDFREGVNYINLARARKALLAIQRRESRHLRVRRPKNDADVREMVHAGLLNVELSDGSSESATVLVTITDAGREFLKIFPPRYRFCDAR